ncbi:unnamed protein product [Acanthoscelides obtectus]|uniref:T-cell activation inhibitor, mitochondrial n=2 Tax=Acanthoscelides obtectus TaxID=200917 RepID=A0A9P0JM10_ACAOB|nr:unnamed protein product [Acanthoscelides obtectus]CAK1634647.1 T-cell activation inhibitor, mitochondrial [Acanthoscelides obtectus]
MLRIQNLCSSQHKYLVFIRKLTTTEVSTALRPFYFSVHPDLFGQYPSERAVNESSLQKLSSALANLQDCKPVKPVLLTFYLKDKTSSKVAFHEIKIHLIERDIKAAIAKILKSCNLPTDYIDSIVTPATEPPESTIRYKNDIDFTKADEHHPIYAHIIMQRKIKEARDALRLLNWLKINHTIALDKYQQGQEYRKEIARLREEIRKDLELFDIRWECGWNDTHFRGCLLSFKSLVDHHPSIRCHLKGRILVFSFFTGVSLDGHIMLYSGEVRHNWLDFLKNIKRYDLALTRIPAFEKSLSHVLRNIKVGRRKFMPKIVAEAYEENLRQITTSLSDYMGSRSYPKEWPESLEDFEIVVETDSGPVMVSPTGQFIVPSSILGTMLVSFITKHLSEARQKNQEYQRNKHLERDLIAECLKELELADLQKEDNITPDLMIKCCQRLLLNKNVLKDLTKELCINISTYYSVLSDGVVCIPWNFEL